MIKVKFQVKAIVLICSVISLSWFFEAMRQLKTGLNFQGIALLGLSVVLTVVLIAIQSFWIYLEEKSKGTLKRKLVYFDNMEIWLKSRKSKQEDLSRS